MKKFFAILLSSILMVTTLAACDNTTDPVGSSTQPIESTSSSTSQQIIESVNSESDSEYTPEGSDFTYSNKSMTEIIGLTDQCINNLVLVFPDTVTKISNISIPASSKITTVMFLNENVELENVNFAGSSITTILNLPTSITSISDNMFYGCTELTTLGNKNGEIIIPNHITNIKPGAFGGCSKITTVDASNVTEISDRAFEGCKNLKNFTFDNITSIGNLSFYMCGFETLAFPDTLNSIGENAFTLNNNLTTVNISDNTKVNKSAFDKCEKLTSNIKFTES